MLVDANVLLCSVDATARHHPAASAWMDEHLSGAQRIALPWTSLGAFLRIATHPRVFKNPLTSAQAWSCVAAWMESPVTWIPGTGERTVAILGELVERHGITANLVPDAQLVAQCIEHGIPVVTFDTDFERFPEIRTIRPGSA